MPKKPISVLFILGDAQKMRNGKRINGYKARYL